MSCIVHLHRICEVIHQRETPHDARAMVGLHTMHRSSVAIVAY